MSELLNATLLAYAATYGAFERWCRANGHRPLLASPGAISAYLTKLAADGKAPATLSHALDGIRHVQRRYDPTWEPHEIIRKVISDARQGSHGGAHRLRLDELDFGRLVGAARAAGGLRGLRDAALLALGHHGSYRRSRLIALDVTDVRYASNRLSIGNLVILSSKDPDICAVNAVHMWLFTAKLQNGPLFRAISKTDRVLDRRLSDRAVTIIAKRAARTAGLDDDRISSDTLRLENLTGSKP